MTAPYTGENCSGYRRARTSPAPANRPRIVCQAPRRLIYFCEPTRRHYRVIPPLAELRLHVRETGRRHLPDLCMISGDPATASVAVRFYWPPLWLMPVFFIHPIIHVLSGSMLRSMTVEVPVSDSNRSYFSRRKRRSWLSAFVAALVGVAVCAGLFQTRWKVKDDLTTAVALTVCAVGCVWGMFFLIYTLSGLRATNVSDRWITLTNVHPDFVAAFEDMYEDSEDDPDRR